MTNSCLEKGGIRHAHRRLLRESLTDHQRENYSISEQTSRLQAFCQAKDITIGKIYTDGGYSGGNLNRPALREMLSHLKEYDVVIVYKLDRLSRSQKDTLLLIEDYFLASKVDFISVCENFDTSTPLGRAMIGMLSVFAQLEKDQITERFTMGRIARAKNGYYHGGSTAPTGYDYVDGRLVINEEEARQVQELYERFRQGHSIHDCWQYMKSRYHTKYGGWNSETLVRNVLRNEVYIGKVKFNQQSYPGNHRPIIREELFREVQKLLQDRSQKDFSSGSSSRKAPFTPRTLLSGLLYCGRCGARFHGEHGNYSCYSRTKGSRKYIKDPACRNRKWKIAELDILIINAVCRLQLEPLPGHQPPDTSPADARETPDPSSGELLFHLLSGTNPRSLPRRRACLTKLIEKIYLDGEEITIILKNVF